VYIKIISPNQNDLAVNETKCSRLKDDMALVFNIDSHVESCSLGNIPNIIIGVQIYTTSCVIARNLAWNPVGILYDRATLHGTSVILFNL